MYHTLIVGFAVDVHICKIDGWLNERLSDDIFFLQA